MPLSLDQSYQQVIARIQQAAAQYQRPAPQLLAVSKKHSTEAIRQLHGLGQRQFGESYWQEAEAKLTTLADLPIEWHYIGPLQANKTRPIAEHFQWVHSVDREKVAQRLNDQRPPELPPLNVCLQVNVDAEASKAGVMPAQVGELAELVNALPRLRLRGLMCLPRNTPSLATQRQPFRMLAALQAQLIAADGLELDTLSMGMSNDLEAAIAEGSTLVRVGSALFGERPKNDTKLS